MGDQLKVLNQQCVSLPSCPMCGYVTDLVEIVVNRTKKSGGGRWVGYAIRCLNSIDPTGIRRIQDPGKLLCTFTMPVAYQPPGD